MKISQQEIIFFIPFRSGSQGYKNKNLTKLNGKPLYTYTIELASKFKNTKIFVSTDYKRSELELPDNVNFIKRSKLLSSNEALMRDVLIDFIDNNVIKNSIIILLQVTSPLRLEIDVHNAIDTFISNSFDLVMSVSEADNSCLKYGFISPKNFYLPVHDINSCFDNRQNLPKLYKPNGIIYIFKSDWFKKNKGFHSNKIGVIKIPKERSIDIDNLQDVNMAEKYLINLKENEDR